MSGIDLPIREIKKMIAGTVHLIVHLERMQDGSRKITHMTEIRGMEREEIFFNDLFLFNFEKIDENGKVVGRLKPSIRYYPLFFQKLQKMKLVSDKIFVNE